MIGGDRGASMCLLLLIGDAGRSKDVKGFEPDNGDGYPAALGRGTIVGGSESGLSDLSSLSLKLSSLDSDFDVIDHGLAGGDVGLRDEEVGGDTGPLLVLAAAIAAAAAAAAAWCLWCWCDGPCCCILCCMRQ